MTGDDDDEIEHGAYRNDDPDTSVGAALQTNATRLQAVVLDTMKRRGPSTTEEIAVFSNESLQSITPRMKPLEERGMVRRTDERRKGASGSSRIVWQLTDLARETMK